MGLTFSAIVDQIVAHASARPTTIAIEEPSGRRMTYAALARDVDAVASGLQQRGLRAGDAVLFTVPPSIASITLIMALVRIGATIVAADPRMGTAVFASRVALARPQWVIADSRVYALGSRLARPMLRLAGLELPSLGSIPASHVRVGPWLFGVPDSVSLERLRASEPRGHAPSSRAASVVLFTSGTTASPKAVVHDERSAGASMEILRDRLGLSPDDIVHSSELYLNVAALLAGATSVVSGFGRLDPVRWLGEVERFRATVAFGVPSEVVRIVDALQRHGGLLPSRLRLMLLGSAPAHRPFLRRLRAVTTRSTTVWSVYAMTEMLPVSAVEMDEKLETDGAGDLVGRPFPEVRVRVADDRELFVAGPNLFRGYLGEPPVTEHATGDLAALDSRGRLAILGRKKEMIIRGHDNVYPSLVESVVESVPGVRRACLVGRYDEARADERIILAVEPVDGEHASRLRRRVRAAIMAGPARIDAAALPDEIVVTDLPTDARSRKVDRSALGERLARMAM